MDDDVLPEDRAYFNSGDCNCDHDAEQHSWGGCVEDGCKCPANWEY